MKEIMWRMLSWVIYAHPAASWGNVRVHIDEVFGRKS